MSKAKTNQKLAKSKKPDFIKAKNIKSYTGMAFLTPKARLAFTQLKKVLIKILIFYHFNHKPFIQIKINTSNYAMSAVLSQLNTNHVTIINRNCSKSKISQ